MIKKLFKKKADKWKEQLEPKKYKVGITSGIPSMDNRTVIQQTQYAVSKGTKVIEIDLEYPTSPTPHDIEELKRLRKAQGLEFTMHGATSVTLPTTSAEKIEYDKVDSDMKAYIKLAKEIGAKGINIHSSYLPSPFLMREVRRTSHQAVDPDGKPIKEKLIKCEKALNWFVKEYYYNKSFENNIKVLQWYLSKKHDTEKVKEIIETTPKEELDKMIINAWKDYAKDSFEEGTEFVAYIIIAWDMYENKDPLWKHICNNKNPDELMKNGEENKLVDAVAAKYLEGHIKKIQKDLEKNKIMLLIETPDCRNQSYRGYFRLVRPSDVCFLMKKIDSPYVRSTIDFEHIATHGLDIMKEIKALGNRDGEYVKMLHTGSQPSQAHLHKPVERGDLFLYKLIWELRKRGFKDGWILFEWSGRGRKEEIEKWEQSVQNLKQMAILLENDIPPDELPPEFFGMTSGEIERERRIIERNMFNPLQGTLEAPELSHTWFGGEIIKKKKPKEVWEKEEYR